MGSRYGYQGDVRNLSTDDAKNTTVRRDGNLESFGVWEKLNPILGRYDLKARGFVVVAPPPTEFGVEVASDGSVLASGRLPGGKTFNYHSNVDLESTLGISLAGQTLLPIGVR